VRLRIIKFRGIPVVRKYRPLGPRSHRQVGPDDFSAMEGFVAQVIFFFFLTKSWKSIFLASVEFFLSGVFLSLSIQIKIFKTYFVWRPTSFFLLFFRTFFLTEFFLGNLRKLRRHCQYCQTKKLPNLEKLPTPCAWYVFRNSEFKKKQTIAQRFLFRFPYSGVRPENTTGYFKLSFFVFFRFSNGGGSLIRKF
jgi:hypothetical protein